MRPVYKLITAPNYATTLPISVDNAKRQLNIDTAFLADDAIIESCIKAAAEYVEKIIQGPIITQTWELQMPDWCDSPLNKWEGDGIQLWKCPVSAVSSLKYFNIANSETEINTANYSTDIASRPARVIFNENYSLPTVYERWDAVRVRFVCGYANEAAIPPDLLQWLKVIMTRFYSYRDFSIDPKFEQAVMDGLKPHMLWL